jgi:hypothetical protein
VGTGEDILPFTGQKNHLNCQQGSFGCLRSTEHPEQCPCPFWRERDGLRISRLEESLAVTAALSEALMSAIMYLRERMSLNGYVFAKDDKTYQAYQRLCESLAAGLGIEIKKTV